MESPAGLPPRQGLYDPRNEHDACGVGFVAHIKGRKSHDIVEKGLTILNNLRHRGATGADPLHGDGAGLLVQIPDAFFREEMAKQGVKLPKAGAFVRKLLRVFFMGSCPPSAGRPTSDSPWAAFPSRDAPARSGRRRPCRP